MALSGARKGLGSEYLVLQPEKPMEHVVPGILVRMRPQNRLSKRWSSWLGLRLASVAKAIRWSKAQRCAAFQLAVRGECAPLHFAFRRTAETCHAG